MNETVPLNHCLTLAPVELPVGVIQQNLPPQKYAPHTLYGLSGWEADVSVPCLNSILYRRLSTTPPPSFAA